MALPIFQSNSQEFGMMQTSWASTLNPVIDSPGNKSILIQNIPLIVGQNVINHKLGRKMQGWRIVDINGVAEIYRSAPLGDLTLTLTSDAAVNISLECF